MGERQSDSSMTSTLTSELITAIHEYNLVSIQEILMNISEEQINKKTGPLKITPLHVACALPADKGLVIARLLLTYGADAKIADKLGRTALHAAATVGSPDLVLLLLEKGANVNASYELTNVGQNVEIFAFKTHEYHHLEAFPLPDCWGRTPLHQAVKYNKAKVVQILLEKGAMVNAQDEHGLTPLLLAGAGVTAATMSEYEDVVRLLIEYEADINLANAHTGTTALHHAVALESVKATEYLLDACAKIQEARCGQTALHEAAEKGNVEILELLVRQETPREINRRDNDGRTVLHKAAFAGSRECIKLLVDHGGDLSAATNTRLKQTVIDAIFKYVPRPMHLLTNILDSKITCNHTNFNNLDFKLNLDFKPLAPRGKNRQMAVLTSVLDLTHESSVNKIMQHPLIECYLHAKWQRLRIFFTILVVNYILFVLSLSSYVILVVHYCEKDCQPKWAKILIHLSRILLFMSTFSIFIHAVIQCILMPRHYFCQYEMWLNLVCAIMSFVIGFFGETEIKAIRKNSTDDLDAVVDPHSWILHIMSITVLLAWTELMLLIGRFPSYGYYALMFSTVLQNVIKVLLTFVCLVFGFALSFAVQFHSSDQFKDPWRAIVKTTVMMMGEFDYADLFKKIDSTDSTATNCTTCCNNSSDDDDTSPRLPATSRMIFLIFIVLASIVLMNLMVGLAVNDIQALQRSGHVQRLVKQAMFLSHLETILSNRLLRSNWIPGDIYKVLYSRRSVHTDITLKPGQVKDANIDTKTLKRIIPVHLMENIVKIAVNNKKLTQIEDQTDAGPMMHMLRMLQEQMLELQEMVRNISQQPVNQNDI